MSPLHWKPNWMRPIPSSRLWDKRRARRYARIMERCAYDSAEGARFKQQARNG